ncbi:hypothetical protein INR49_020921, partial [Caranx melampygus]
VRNEPSSTGGAPLNLLGSGLPPRCSQTSSHDWRTDSEEDDRRTDRRQTVKRTTGGQTGGQTVKRTTGGQTGGQTGRGPQEDRQEDRWISVVQEDLGSLMVPPASCHNSPSQTLEFTAPPPQSSSPPPSFPFVPVISALVAVVLLVLVLVLVLVLWWRRHTGMKVDLDQVQDLLLVVSCVHRCDVCSENVTYGRVVIRGQRAAGGRRTAQPDPDVVYSSVRGGQ